jgi:hypothetical protein
VYDAPVWSTQAEIFNELLFSRLLAQGSKRMFLLIIAIKAAAPHTFLFRDVMKENAFLNFFN